MSKSLFIIDCDCGVDDAEALITALLAPGVDVLAITTVRGNTSQENASSNVLRVLKVLGREQIPVFPGATSGLVGTVRSAGKHHGEDGFGGVAHTIAVDTAKLQKEHAANAQVRLINEHPGKITLITLGPMTNVALALRLDPLIATKLKELVIMGGNTAGRGNHFHSTVFTSEFNFAADPEAAGVCVRELACPRVVVPWETIIETPLPWVSSTSPLTPKLLASVCANWRVRVW